MNESGAIGESLACGRLNLLEQYRKEIFSAQKRQACNNSFNGL